MNEVILILLKCYIGIINILNSLKKSLTIQCIIDILLILGMFKQGKLLICDNTTKI
jgi:hypothetical protein